MIAFLAKVAGLCVLYYMAYLSKSNDMAMGISLTMLLLFDSFKIDQE